MLNFFTIASNVLSLLALIILLFITFNAKESKAYFNLSILFTGFFALFFFFNVFKLLDNSFIAGFLELIALISLLVFSVYHLKIEGFEQRGEQ